eukprot:jgi/Tetstr1/463458/TSEL_008351.t1
MAERVAAVRRANPSESDTELVMHQLGVRQAPLHQRSWPYQDLVNTLMEAILDSELSPADCASRVYNCVAFGRAQLRADISMVDLEEQGRVDAMTAGSQRLPFVDLVMETVKLQRNWNDKLKGVEARTPALLKRVGPNEKCPCGSGMKYKKCHKGVSTPLDGDIANEMNQSCRRDHYQ